MIRIPLSRLTNAETVAALGRYSGRRMTWACRDAKTAAAFDRIVNHGDLTASPGRATFAPAYDWTVRSEGETVTTAATPVPRGTCRDDAPPPKAPRQMVPFAQREAARRAYAGRLARMGV